jgi:hypothetical protein
MSHEKSVDKKPLKRPMTKREDNIKINRKQIGCECVELLQMD